MAITKLAPKNIIKKSISYFSILWPINAQMYVSPIPLASNTICLICTSSHLLMPVIDFVLHKCRNYSSDIQ